MTLPRLITGLRELADEYNAILCDVWGVLHNGREPFVGADTALAQFREAGGKVLLLSNAPRPGATLNLKRRQGVAGPARGTNSGLCANHCGCVADPRPGSCQGQGFLP